MINRKLNPLNFPTAFKTRTTPKRNYELVLSDFIIHKGYTLYRIRSLVDYRALRGFSLCSDQVSPGTLGGYIESIENLSGNAWVEKDAKVYEQAHVHGDASVEFMSEIFGKAEIFGRVNIKSSNIFGQASVSGYSTIEHGEIYDRANIFDSIVRSSKIYGRAQVLNDSFVDSNSAVYGNAKLIRSRVTTESSVYDNAILTGAYVCNSSKAYGNTQLLTDFKICGRAESFGDSKRFYEGKDYVEHNNFRTTNTIKGKKNFIKGNGKDDSYYYENDSYGYTKD